MKRTNITILDPIFRAEFFVQRGGDINDLLKRYAKACKRDTWEATQANRYGYCGGYDDDKGGAIWLHQKAGCGAIVHEALHATHRVMRILEVTLNDNTEEIFAYYTDWLVRGIVQRLF